MRVVGYFERFVLLRKSLQDVVHKESFRHIHLQVLQLGRYISHLHDVLMHTLHVSESQRWKLHNQGAGQHFVWSFELLMYCLQQSPNVGMLIDGTSDTSKNLVFMNMTLRRLDRSQSSWRANWVGVLGSVRMGSSFLIA